MRRNQARRNNNPGGYEQFFDESGETGERGKSLGVFPSPLKVSFSSGPESAIRVLRTKKGQL